MDGRYWWQSHNLSIENDVLSYGSGTGIYLIATLPAIRLAGVAIGQTVGSADPAAVIMNERYAVLSELSGLERRFWRGETRLDRLQQQLDEVRRLITRYPASERLAYATGNLELRLGHIAEADRSLNECLAHPLCARPTRVVALYDLACVAARSGRPDECRTHLEAFLALSPHQRTNVGKDSDFESVKDAPWFKGIVGEATPAPT
jgi:hypothetical protein